MAGKVFVSCGQSSSERAAAAAVGQVLRDEFALTPYIAVEVHVLGSSDLIGIEFVDGPGYAAARDAEAPQRP